MNEYTRLSRDLRTAANQAASGRPCRADVIENGADAIDALVARIAELEAAQKWRPVGTEPRDESDFIRITEAHWSNHFRRIVDDCAIGWLPLPPGEVTKG